MIDKHSFLDQLPQRLDEDYIDVLLAHEGTVEDFLLNHNSKGKNVAALILHQGAYEAMPQLFTDEVLKRAAKWDGWVLMALPRERLTYELCGLAVKETGMVLQYVPEEYKDYSMCRSALEENPQAKHYIPWEMLSRLGISSPSKPWVKR